MGNESPVDEAEILIGSLELQAADAVLVDAVDSNGGQDNLNCAAHRAGEYERFPARVTGLSTLENPFYTVAMKVNSINDIASARIGRHLIGPITIRR